MAEQIDILTSDGKKTGEVRSRDEVHKLGLWHRTVHIWLFDAQGNILFQLRAHDKENNPNLYDTSCAGHISAGDESLESALREIREELGLKESGTSLSLIATGGLFPLVRPLLRNKFLYSEALTLLGQCRLYAQNHKILP